MNFLYRAYQWLCPHPSDDEIYKAVENHTNVLRKTENFLELVRDWDHPNDTEDTQSVLVNARSVATQFVDLVRGKPEDFVAYNLYRWARQRRERVILSEGENKRLNVMYERWADEEDVGEEFFFLVEASDITDSERIWWVVDGMFGWIRWRTEVLKLRREEKAKMEEKEQKEWAEIEVGEGEVGEDKEE